MVTLSPIYEYIRLYWDELKPAYGSQKSVLRHYHAKMDTLINRFTYSLGGEQVN